MPKCFVLEYRDIILTVPFLHRIKSLLLWNTFSIVSQDCTMSEELKLQGCSQNLRRCNIKEWFKNHCSCKKTWAFQYADKCTTANTFCSCYPLQSPTLLMSEHMIFFLFYLASSLCVLWRWINTIITKRLVSQKCT